MAQPNKIISKARRDTKVGEYSFPEDLGQHQIIFVFRKYSFENPGTRKLIDNVSYSKKEIRDIIALPIPGNIADSYSIRLSRPEVGLVAEGIASATSEAHNAGSTAGLARTIYDRIASNGIDASSAKAIMDGNLEGVSSNARYLIRSNLPSFIATGLDLGAGQAVNPKLALSFEGVDLKSHSFDWNFMVRSPRESDTLKDIQNAIKKNIHPSYSHLGTIQRAMLTYPSVVDVFFSGLDGSYFVKFKTCMVQAYSINFTPQGLAIMEGGKPAAAQMSLQMIETDIHTAEDYGGEGGGTSLDYNVDEIEDILNREKGKTVQLPTGVQIG